MVGPTNLRRLPEQHRQALIRRYLGKGRTPNPNVNLSDRIANMLVEKRLPEQVLAVLQNPKSNQRERKKLIQQVLFGDYHVSSVFGIKKLSPKERQSVFRTLYKTTLQVLEASGQIHINRRTGQPLPSSRQRVMQRNPNYVGVCDVTSKRLARALVHDFIKYNPDPRRKLMIGVMTHPIVLNPDLPVPKPVRDEVSRTFPKIGDIANGFIDDPHVLNTIHIADLYGPKGPRGAGEAQNVLRNLELCVKHGGKNLHAIQLDINWPKPDEIREFKKRHPNISLVLQVGKFSLKDCNNNPQNVVNRLREYGNTIDYALLDLSMGKGKAMTSENLVSYLRLIKTQLPNLGLSVAGGLGPTRSKELDKIAREFPNVSFDAQGGLKPNFALKDSLGHFYGTDPVDPTKSRDYFRHNR